MGEPRTDMVKMTAIVWGGMLAMMAIIALGMALTVDLFGCVKSGGRFAQCLVGSLEVDDGG